jgi:hypothetical protein
MMASQDRPFKNAVRIAIRHEFLSNSVIAAVIIPAFVLTTCLVCCQLSTRFVRGLLDIRQDAK